MRYYYTSLWMEAHEKDKKTIVCEEKVEKGTFLYDFFYGETRIRKKIIRHSLKKFHDKKWNGI